MFNERAFIARVEQSDVEQFAALLTRPSAEEERALRTYFGDDRYRELHALSVKRRVRGPLRGRRGNVVVLHGIMGGELTATRGGASDQIWAKAFALLRGHAARLQLAEDGRSELDSTYQVHASGIMKRAYGELLLGLAERWNVRAFWYDWRKDLTLAAGELRTKIDAWFGPEAPVHLVAHSMGGLVARTFIRDHADRWRKMADARNPDNSGRLVMLGTPNHGSFAIPQVLTGLEGMVRKLAMADLRHSLGELLAVFNSFPGSYQMLPSPAKADVAWLYNAGAYGRFPVSQAHLDAARRHHESLAAVIDPARMVYVAGFDQPTFNGFSQQRPDVLDAYSLTREGDGRVPHTLGRLDGVRMYFVREGHGDLAANRTVLGALDDLLVSGTTSALPQEMPALRAVQSQEQLLAEVKLLRKRERAEFEQLVRRTEMRGGSPAVETQVTRLERELEERLSAGFLPRGGPGSAGASRAARPDDTGPAPRGPATTPAVDIAIVTGRIEQTDAIALEGPAIDAIAVGHYLGVSPQYAELALDRALSAAVSAGAGGATGGDGTQREAQLLLTQYAERGILRGELGQPFFLPDPRQGEASGVATRVIALAGMGFPGRFGTPELTVLARELCWALGRMGKRHLATVLIGAGAGNMSTTDAIGSWLRGLAQALNNAGTPAERLLRVTLVELNPKRTQNLRKAVRRLIPALAPELRIRLLEVGADTNGRTSETPVDEGAPAGRGTASRPVPVRMTVDFASGTYRFGAITDRASVPERDIAIDPALVRQANTELAGEDDRRLQVERGEFLARLLLPAEMRAHLTADVPIVMAMDTTAAQIHWEMLAQAEAGGGASKGPLDEQSFLSVGRGLTRQLRTTFAPPPEPPPPPRRVLRVLVVADPAADLPLPGAEAEGVEVAELMESFNTVHAESGNRVEVVRLFGPSEATRTNVLRELMVRRYDVLHFAGHCVYDSESPLRSGWIFSDGHRLTANELTRIDTVPKFVFSNACESGITPDRAERRAAALAPTFAEAFFARGVSNFVCTAWPVDDLAARIFALCVYGRLLGLEAAGPTPGRYRPRETTEMYRAMRDARLDLWTRSFGAQTWGAYQHYGDPFFRLFDVPLPDGPPPEAAPENGAPAPVPTVPKKHRTKSKKPQRPAGK
jgi:pimeloyl-ACP methyl ester carboxylesterase